MVAFAHPSAAAESVPAPRQPLAVLEVVRHPRGGWTIAVPVDGSVSTVRIFRGCWPTEAEAQRFLELNYLAYAS
jgi:hypothetical protein